MGSQSCSSRKLVVVFIGSLQPEQGEQGLGGTRPAASLFGLYLSG